MSELVLRFDGPFQWLNEERDDYVFSAESAPRPGIYFWTLPTVECERVYYVGETGRTLAKRHEEHLLAYLGGLYRIYDPSGFRANSKVLLWPGMWRGKGVRLTARYLEALPKLVPELSAFLKLFSLFLAPVELDQRLRHRVEAALVDHFRSLDGELSLQDTDIRYRGRKEGETPVPVTVKARTSVPGLPVSLLV